MKKKQPINKHFVSDIDQRLAEFNKSHKPSASQQAEIDKYKDIYHKRDHATNTNPKKDLWD